MHSVYLFFIGMPAPTAHCQALALLLHWKQSRKWELSQLADLRDRPIRAAQRFRCCRRGPVIRIQFRSARKYREAELIRLIRLQLRRQRAAFVPFRFHLKCITQSGIRKAIRSTRCSATHESQPNRYERLQSDAFQHTDHNDL